MPEVVAIGETMVMFSPQQSGPLSYVHSFQKRIAGAESNVAIGLSRLGHSSGWISKVGEDEFGRFVVREIRAEGVDVSRVRTCDGAPTGIMFKEILEGRETRVHYYRKDSAASRLTPEDIDSQYITASKILHLTGITPALSGSCLDTVMHVIRIAKQNGILVSFDPNIRLKLWCREDASRVLKTILPYVDVVLAGVDEGNIIFGTESCNELMDSFLALGAKTVALKMGAEGSWAADCCNRIRIRPIEVNRVVDPIGAGDAFSAGFLAGILEGMSLEECGRLANAMGAFAVTSAGDFEGLPFRNELDAFIKGYTQISR